MRALLLLSGILVVCASAMLAQISVTTVNYDNNRTNTNLQETVLSASNVTPSTFGKLYTYPVDGYIYTQPLYVAGLTLPAGRTVNAVFVATMHNTVYAFDADAERDRVNPVLWSLNLGPSVPAANYGTRDIDPEVGILSTPALDLNTNTLYVVANTLEADGKYYYRIHALDLATGAEKFGGPAAIQAMAFGSSAEGDTADSSGVVAFDSSIHLQRMGLIISQGVLYIGFGSHGDLGNYHGWLLGYDASNVSNLLYTFDVTPNGGKGALWQSGRGPAVDGDGNLYVETANGDFDGVANFSQTFLKLDPHLAVLDYFTPSSWYSDGPDLDDDLGSNGPTLVPGTNLLVGGSKLGSLYVMSSQAMGGIQDGDGQIVQSFPAVGFGIFNTALWNRSDGPLFYLQADRDGVKAFRMDLSTGQFTTSPVSESNTTNGTPYQGMTVSSNGEQPGTAILWTTSADDTMHAFDALDLTNELWNSNMNYDRDNIGSFAKFASPTVVNGKVFVPTFASHLLMYGLLDPAQALPAPSGGRR